MDEITELYLQGYSTRKIAQKLNTSQYSIIKHLKEQKLLRGRGRYPLNLYPPDAAPRIPRKLPVTIIPEIIWAYLYKGMTLKQLADNLKVTPQAISKLFKKLNVPTRRGKQRMVKGG